MSNHLAISTATETIRQVVQDAATLAVPGATAIPAKPESGSTAPPGAEVRIYLYQVTPNPHWRNSDLPARNSRGAVKQRPQLALDLHYLFVFYGNDSDHEPQRLLGAIASALHSRPTLTREQVQAAANSVPVLSQSDLAGQVELVRLTPEALSLEELTKLWSVFFQTTYALSMPYQATVILIEADESGGSGPPVQTVMSKVLPFPQPSITSVTAESGEYDPITTQSTLQIIGHGLKGSATAVMVGGQDMTASATSIEADKIILPLPTVLPPGFHAGLKSVRIVHKVELGEPPTPRFGFDSNVAAFVLQPRLDPLPTLAGPVTSNVVNGVTYQSGALSLSFDPVVGINQQVVLLLNEKTNTAPSRAYSFKAPPFNGITSSATETGLIEIPFENVATGDYLVRVQVDGAESPLDMVNGVYDGPTVTI
jgi:hypothetical protein